MHAQLIVDCKQGKITAKLLYNITVKEEEAEAKAEEKIKRFAIALIFCEISIATTATVPSARQSGESGGREILDETVEACAALSSRFLKLREANDARAIQAEATEDTNAASSKRNNKNHS